MFDVEKLRAQHGEEAARAFSRINHLSASYQDLGKTAADDIARAGLLSQAIAIRDAFEGFIRSSTVKMAELTMLEMCAGKETEPSTIQAISDLARFLEEETMMAFDGRLSFYLLAQTAPEGSA